MGPERTGKLQAAVQTAGQAASYVWVVTLLDFTSGGRPSSARHKADLP
jgi:hypothetical protein